MDEVMHYHNILFSACEWKAARGMDLATARRPAGMPSSGPFFYLGGGYVSFLHNNTMLTGFPHGLPGGRLPWRNPPATLRRRHHLLHSGFGVGGPVPSHHDGDILRLFRAPAEQSQIHVCRFWPVYVRIYAMCWHFGDANRHAPHLILRPATD